MAAGIDHLETELAKKLGMLHTARLSRFDANGTFQSDDQTTKEMPLHCAFYGTRSSAGAVVHLHSCHCVALSMMPHANEDNFLQSSTPYSIMKLGKVKLLPFFLPGDLMMGEAVQGLAGKRSAVMLAHHGPVVADKDKDIEAVCNAVEELEEAAKLAMLLRGVKAQLLNDREVRDIVTHFDVEWDYLRCKINLTDA